jgi:hypothetical protein
LRRAFLFCRLAGYGYHRYYKYLVLQKIECAFKPGDPVLDLAAHHDQLHQTAAAAVGQKASGDGDWYPRGEQNLVDDIVSGRARGHYYLMVGEKGTGKSSMLIDAMHRVSGEGVSMLETHGDLEIFRIRLGKALDFEYHEDYVGSLFSIRGPRDTTPLLDIERAFNKLEKVALRRRNTVGRPLVLIINNVHLLRDDEDGQNLLELVQQRAEQWAASDLATVVLNSDDYWVYERLKKNACRMTVLPITDLPKERAIAALKASRRRHFGSAPPDELLESVYDRVGGRIMFLNRVASSPDMLQACDEIFRTEKTWFLNQCWILGEEMDDDVMDQQKYAVCPSSSLPGFSFLSLLVSLSLAPIDILLVVGSNGASQGPGGHGKGDGAALRSAEGPYSARSAAARGAPDHDARRLHPEVRPPEPLHHRLARHGPRRLGADDARLPRHMRAGGL